MTLRRVAVAVLVLALLAVSSRAQCEIQQFTSPNLVSGDQFGLSAAIQDDVIVIGSQQGGPGSEGRMWIFRQVEGLWEEEALFTPPPPGGANWFGHDVDIDGDVILASVPLRSSVVTLAGSIFVFRWNGVAWVQEQELMAPDAEFNDGLGRSAAVSGDTIVAGAPGEDTKGNNAGAAYVWVFDGIMWQPQAKLLPRDISNNDQFGWACDIQGDRAVIGARLGDCGAGGVPPGAVYVYERSGTAWELVDKIIGPALPTGTEFGSAVALDGDATVVGAWAEDQSNGTNGATYVYRLMAGAWELEAKLTIQDPVPNLGGEVFGTTVAISGDTILVGARLEDSLADGSGSAYLFRRNGTTWDPGTRLVASDGGFSDLFGESVAIEAGRGVICASQKDQRIGIGSAYYYEGLAAMPPWTGLGSPLAGTTCFPCLTGEGPLINGTRVTLMLDNVLPSMPTVLVTGLSMLSVPFKGGTLVPAPDLLLPGLVSDAQGELALSGTWPSGIPGGTEIVFQAWSPDDAAVAGLAASNALLAVTQ